LRPLKKLTPQQYFARKPYAKIYRTEQNRPERCSKAHPEREAVDGDNIRTN
jgi:hypothetical protein